MKLYWDTGYYLNHYSNHILSMYRQTARVLLRCPWCFQRMFSSLQKGWKLWLRWKVSEWHPMWEAQGSHKLLRERRRYYELHIDFYIIYNLFLANLFFGYIHFLRFWYNQDHCNPNPCQNGGTCQPDGSCICPPHCKGRRCEFCEGNYTFLQHKNWYVKLCIFTSWPMNYL